MALYRIVFRLDLEGKENQHITLRTKIHKQILFLNLKTKYYMQYIHAFMHAQAQIPLLRSHQVNQILSRKKVIDLVCDFFMLKTWSETKLE